MKIWIIMKKKINVFNWIKFWHQTANKDKIYYKIKQAGPIIYKISLNFPFKYPCLDIRPSRDINCKAARLFNNACRLLKHATRSKRVKWQIYFFLFLDLIFLSSNLNKSSGKYQRRNHLVQKKLLRTILPLNITSR